MENQKKKGSYDFLNLQIDLQKRRLMCGEDIVSLTPKEFELLLLLTENSGKVIEKDELLEKIWQDTFVEEGTLARNISWLRKKLSVYTGEEKIIETLPKRGYRFLPEVKFNQALQPLQSNQIQSNQIFIEEEIIQEIQIEERFEFNENPQNTLLLKSANRKNSFILLFTAFVLLAFISFFIYQFVYAIKPSKIILTSKIVPFTSLGGKESSPAFSPDGKQIVYAWNGGKNGENTNIYLKLIGSGEPVRLTNNKFNELNPTFSPDGKSIAFVRLLPNNNEIILIPALGGAERKLYEQASYASLSFSPDGKFIAHTNLDLAKNETGIFLLNIETGQKIQITKPDFPTVDHTPRISPDGKFIAFIRYFNSFRREIFVVPIDGGETKQITNDEVRIFGLDWDFDGKSLFFTSYRETNQLNLWKISIDKSEPQLIPTNSKILQELDISPNGKTIAFVEENADENIWQITANENPKLLISSISADHSQQISPDGKHIAFVSDRSGNFEIWMADADGKNQRQLTNTKSSAGSPRFSPDGKYIVYDAQNAKNSDIYIISVNGGEPFALTKNSQNNFLPTWSSDGQEIYFISNRVNGNQMWKISAKGGEAIPLTKQGAFESFAVKDKIIYSKGDGKQGLWIIDKNGENEAQIPELANVGAWRSWFANEKGVYFTAFSTQPPYIIKFFDFETKQTKDIVQTEKSPLLYYSNLSVSFDEKKFLYAQEDQSLSTIQLVELNE